MTAATSSPAASAANAAPGGNTPPNYSPGLEGAARAFAEQAGVPLGQVAQPLRAALTGRTVSPGIFDVMVTLGRDLALARLAAIQP